MGRRHEEKVDVEELARLENPEDGSSTKIRVKMPNRRINEMKTFSERWLEKKHKRLSSVRQSQKDLRFTLIMTSLLGIMFTVLALIDILLS